MSHERTVKFNVDDAVGHAAQALYGRAPLGDTVALPNDKIGMVGKPWSDTPAHLKLQFRGHVTAVIGALAEYASQHSDERQVPNLGYTLKLFSENMISARRVAQDAMEDVIAGWSDDDRADPRLRAHAEQVAQAVADKVLAASLRGWPKREA